MNEPITIGGREYQELKTASELLDVVNKAIDLKHDIDLLADIRTLSGEMIRGDSLFLTRDDINGRWYVNHKSCCGRTGMYLESPKARALDFDCLVIEEGCEGADGYVHTIISYGGPTGAFMIPGRIQWLRVGITDHTGEMEYYYLEV